jgi:hypothetical protein
MAPMKGKTDPEGNSPLQGYQGGGVGPDRKISGVAERKLAEVPKNEVKADHEK